MPSSPGPRGPRRRLERLACISLLVAQGLFCGCEQLEAVLNADARPAATPVPAEVALGAGGSVSVLVSVCPPLHYTTDVGFVPFGASRVSVATGPLPSGVQAVFDRSEFSSNAGDFGPQGDQCAETRLTLSAAADADLGREQTVMIGATSPQTPGPSFDTPLRLLPAAPPGPQDCSARAAHRWQPLGDGLLAVTPDLEPGGVQLARHGQRVLAAWWEREHLPERFFVRTRQHDGNAWRALGDAVGNAGDDTHVEHLQLRSASPPAAPADEAWLSYASSSGFGLGHPAQLVVRRLGPDDRFGAAAPPLAIGSPQTLRVQRSRHGLYAATVARGDSQLRLWHADPAAAVPAWTAVRLRPALADTTVRQVAFATERDGTALLALNRIDREGGAYVERLQTWRLGSDGDPASMSQVGPDHEIRRYVSFFGPGAGAHTVLLLRDDAAPAAQATVLAWFTGDGTDAFGLVGRADGAAAWAPIGELAAFTQAAQFGTFVKQPTLVAGCEGRPTLAWSDAQSYPIYAIRSFQADAAAAHGFAGLGGGPVHGDAARYSGDGVALLWNGVGGDPLALVLRQDLQTRQQELALRTLRP